MHGGHMWLDKPISIETNLIARITRLPTQGEDPTMLFAKKKYIKSTVRGYVSEFSNN
jgi:hypothetical protein